ncbi:RHS repeat domain-containing protein [Rhizorhabdus sp. FW153]|uniref:hypothetical protein n=1 Tax=Rhizorhabdus sp. FW153 TaxID=3400216 RepID=UPI003CE9B91E
MSMPRGRNSRNIWKFRDRRSSDLGFRAIPILAVAYLAPSVASAAAPAVVIAAAPLVSPSAALSYYGNPVSPAAPAARDVLVKEMARSLRYDIDNIFQHVRDNVETVPIWGAQKGARGVILDGYGTSFDQAQFLVDMLREADAVAGARYNPSYVLGQISLSASQFSAWTGVNDAAAATRLLANGGIPASVTGSGSSFTVVMGHIWVRASVNGVVYLFDPGYKSHSVRSAMGWQGASGYSGANLLSAGGGGTDPAIVNGFNATSFTQTLNTYRGNVETYLGSNADGVRADAVVGYSTIIAHPSSENRRTSLPYVVAQDSVWAGQIPDAYRASITVSLNGDTYGTYFADVDGGLVREFTYFYDTGTSSFKKVAAFVNPVLIGNYAAECDAYLGGRAAVAPAIASIQINHPYAANSGQYADRILTKPLVDRQCVAGHFYVTNDWGYTGSGIATRMAAPVAKLGGGAPPGSKPMQIGTTLTSVANKYSQFLDLAGTVQGNIFLVHDLIGVHTVDEVATKMDPPIATPSSFLTMDYEAAVSAISLDGLGDTGAAFTAGLGLSYIEGSVPRQETDAVYDMAAVNLITQQQARATSGNTFRTFLATPATWNSVKNSLASDYPVAAVAAIEAYVAEGYSVLAPEHGGLRQQKITVANPGITRTATLIEGNSPTGLGEGPELVRSAFLAWKSNGGLIERVALGVYDPRHGRVLKGGIGVAQDPVANTIRMPDIPKVAAEKSLRSAANVDDRSGALTYVPSADLSDGFGEFPYALTFQRAYDQRDQTNYGVGIGWKTNWNQVASFSNDGSAALGQSGGQAAASSLVTLLALKDLVTTQNAQRLYGALQSIAWLGDQTINNTVVISRGLGGEKTFYKQANGTFLSASADGETLTQTGSPETGIINRRLYHPVSLDYRDRDGTLRKYPSFYSGSSLISSSNSPDIASLLSQKSLYMSRWDFPSGVRIYADYYNLVATPGVFGLNSVRNNLGARIQLNQGADLGSATRQPVCTFVSLNNFALSWLPARPAKVSYVTNGGSSFSILLNPQSASTPVNNNFEYGCNSSGKAVYSDGDTSRLITQSTTGQTYVQGVVDAVGNSWGYANTLVAETNPLSFGGYTALSAIYKPSQPSTPALNVARGLEGNVTSITDLNNHSWTYFTSPFRSEDLSPLQASSSSKRGTVSYFDRWGQAITSVDPLLRTTKWEYDDLGRVTSKMMPEGNREKTAYDARGNIVQITQCAKSGCGAGDLITQFGYVEAATVRSCSDLTVCNKVLWSKDPLLQRTNYTWTAGSGQLQDVRKGLDSSGANCLITNGICPYTIFNYTLYSRTDPANGASAGSVRMPTSQRDTISSSASVTTAYGYKSDARLLMNEQVVDSGGLSLRTCFRYDSAGNLISKTAPRANLTSCP